MLVLCTGVAPSLDLELQGRSGEARKEGKDKTKQIDLYSHLGLWGGVCVRCVGRGLGGMGCGCVLVRQGWFVDQLVGF